MSTKIYEAYRIPLSKLNNFIDFSREYTLRKVAQNYLQLMKAVEIDMATLPNHINPDDKAVVKRWEMHNRFDGVIKNMEKHLNGPLKTEDPFYLECGLNIWIYRQHAYIIPIKSHITNARKPSYVKNYCYWNNTDRLSGISDKEWEARGDVWEKINCGDGTASHNARRMYHAFIELGNGLHLGTWPIKEVLFGKGLFGDLMAGFI